MSTMSRAAAAQRLIPALAALSTAAFVPSTAAPQLPVELRLRAFAGAVDARGDLPNAPILSSPTSVVSYEGLSVVPLLGVSVEGRTPAIPVSLRLSIARSLGGDEVGVWGCPPTPTVSRRHVRRF